MSLSFNSVELAQILETPLGDLGREPYSEMVTEQRKKILKTYKEKRFLYGFSEASSIARSNWIEENVFPLIAKDRPNP